MLSQAARLGEVYLKNFLFVIGEVTPQNCGVNKMVGASDRDHGTQPPAAFVLESLARAAVFGPCRASLI
ncbi:hypothetical protein YSA_00730 [Pseudomonas putida ND6]|uniref:Uncharacterized protein n=1 Tax=Pseudomonas putida ND6 TaxID=231023 RepID=I3UNV3_PSEPU|nr:hypothetical protein YSA_00730 [Pseudomonas putida ND6]